MPGATLAMLLAVDIGNTNITLAAFSSPASLDRPFDPEPLRRWAASSAYPREADEFRVLFRQLFFGEDAERFDFTHAVLGSVVPPLSRAVREGLLGCFPNLAVLEVESDSTPLPVRNAYRTPSEVGVDRLANAAGGYRLFGAPLIAVDVGTATTLDIVDLTDTGSPYYAGGVILPGPVLAAEALSQRSARLPRVAPARPRRVVADTTAGALQAGIYWGMIGAIDLLAEKIVEERGWTEAVIVATGGQSGAVAADSRMVQKSEPRLTLFGFAEIWRFVQLGKIPGV